MELGTEISQKVKKTIKKQLQTLGSYVDDELPEYIMVMLANKRTKEQMVEDLHLFLNDEAEKFVTWLFSILEKIKKAITLSDFNEDDDSDTENPKKKKKAKKEEIDDPNEPAKKTLDDKTKRKFKETKEENKINSKKSSESDKKGLDKYSKAHDKKETRRERSVDKTYEKRRRSRDRRNSHDEERRTRRKRSVSRERRKFPLGDRIVEGGTRRSRLGSPDGAQREENSKQNDNQERKTPMDFVKQIAKNINERIIGNVGKDSTVTSEETLLEHNESDKPDIVSPDDEVGDTNKVTVSETAGVPSQNVSLQAVVQYEGDGENEKDKNESVTKTDNSQVKKDRDKKERRRRSNSPRSRTHRKSRSRERRRSRSPVQRHRSSPGRRQTRRRSRSREELKRISERSRRERRASDRNNKKVNQRRERKDSHRRSPPRESVEHADEEKPDDPNVNSQVKVYTDFKRKPTLSKTHQASTALLKKAFSEVATDTVNDKNKSSGDEDVELDYSDDAGDTLHESLRPADDTGSDRRVINFNQKSSGLATITVNFKSNESASESESGSEDQQWVEKGGKDSKSGMRVNSRKDSKMREMEGVDSMDARYAIMKTRLEQETNEQSKDRTKSQKPKQSKKKFVGSMVADLEEKTHEDMKKRKKYERRQDRKRAFELQRSSHVSSRLETTVKDRTDSVKKRRSSQHSKKHQSSDEEMMTGNLMDALTEETRRIKMQELQRSIEVAREGDLRTLLTKKQQSRTAQQSQEKSLHKANSPKKSSSSEDEETVERKLREKIKEEKHKRLFGKLNRDERNRLQKEREDLRRQLAQKQRKRRDSSTHKSRRKKDSTSAVHEGNAEDQWNEDMPKQQKQTNVQRQDEKKKEIDKKCHYDNKSDNGDLNNGEQILNSDHESNNHAENDVHVEKSTKMEREEWNERNPVEDENSDRESEHRGVEVSAEVMLASMHGGVSLFDSHSPQNENIDESEQREGNVCGDEETKDQPVAEDEEERMELNEPINNEEEEESNDVNNRTKKRRTKQEFIVTLDGYEDTLKQKHDRQKRRRLDDPSEQQQQQQQPTVDGDSISQHTCKRSERRERTQSDEEFEQILRKKEKEEEAQGESRVKRYSTRSTTKHKQGKSTGEQHHNKHNKQSKQGSKSSSDDYNKVDKEILLAEQKLQTQKLLKKSLEQVQNLDPYMGEREPKKTKTAFVNPHFLKNKIDIPVVNVVPLNVAGQPISPLATIPQSSPILYPAANLQTTYSEVATQSKRIPPQVNVVKPVVSVSTSVENGTIVTTAPILSPTTSPTTSVSNVPIDNATISLSCTTDSSSTEPQQQQTRQQLDQLKSIPCKTFPNCSFGNRCLYMHPPCKFGEGCTNLVCIFSHVTSPFPQSSTLCKYFPNCKKVGCPYKHAKPCHYGSNCNNTDCPFYHEPATSRTSLKWVAEKPHISERKFAVDEKNVSVPVTFKTSTS